MAIAWGMPYTDKYENGIMIKEQLIIMREMLYDLYEIMNNV